jgi:hypothetical protein
MQPKPKFISFLNQVFLDVKAKEETESITYTNDISIKSDQPAYINPMPALEEALLVLESLSSSMPPEKQKQILRQALHQHGDGHLDQVLLEATLRKAQMIQAMQSCSQDIDGEIASVNAEIDRLWNLRDQVSEKAKQHQWALLQENAQLDSMIRLMVDSPTNEPAPDTASPIVGSVASRNPRRLSTLATTTN